MKLKAAALGSTVLAVKHITNSPTSDDSLNNVRKNLNHLEGFHPFNTDESSPERYTKLKKHHSSNF